jgi:hypothetical protein
MAFKPKYSGNQRDKTYPSQIAAERPMLTTRIHCYEYSTDGNESLAGGEHDEHTESAIERFNRQLRSGIGTGRPTED